MSQSENREQGKQQEGCGTDVSVSDWTERTRVNQRTFPGPRGVKDSLRVAVERRAYADLVAHAAETLDTEVCGVLAGVVCEDDEGLFISVQAIIQGSSTRQGSAHVTFTQDTWNCIHETMERDYPKCQIVGWYHSHPGFGVEFSDMDIFIQQNFFPAPTQIALVTDPLGGDVAICYNASDGIKSLERFWVDGREHRCRTPKKGADAHELPDAAQFREELSAVEARLNQVVQAVDDMRAGLHRFLVTVAAMVFVALAVWISLSIYKLYAYPVEPPRLQSYMPVPVRVGDETVLLGVGIAEWKVPPRLNSIYLQLEKEKLKEEQRRVRKKIDR